MCLNASLAGLVGITAGCDVLDCFGAVIVGVVSGFLVCFGVWLLDYKLHIDDPVGAVAVHMMNGIWGTIAVGLFSTTSVPGNDSFEGLCYGGGFDLLGKQLLGIVTVAGWTLVTMSIVFFTIKKTFGLRATKQEEILGLDVTEHGLISSYADFAPAMSEALTGYTESDAKSVTKVPVEKAVEVESYVANINRDDKLTKIVAIFKQNRLQEFISAMEEIDVTGITVTNVLGCGIQKGRAEFYRGTPLEVNLLPKVKAEIVVCSVPVEKVIDAARSTLYTGHIGDGKLFIYDVENVIKVRTGEQGKVALLDKE